MSSREVKILSILSFSGLIVLVWAFKLFMSKDSFLSSKILEPEISVEEEAWDEYEKERDEKNRARMKENYDELMVLGGRFTRNKNYHDAAACYWYAKTIYPERETPRRLLSESYMRLCSEYGEYCGAAKKEVYFAFKYVRDTSIYYSDLLDMASGLDMYQYIDQHEDDVLPLIYSEQHFHSF